MGKTLTTSMRVLDGVSHQLRAVDYLRVSTEEQAKGYGVQYSGKKTKKYISSKGWAHVETYIDEGVSGSLEAHERGDLRRLMADAHTEPRPFDVVVVNEGRAIGRQGRAFWKWVWDLEELNVFVAVVQDDYDNTNVDGRKKMRRDADYAETEWETIRSRTQNGIQEKAEDGLYPGGTVPYGWKVSEQGVKHVSYFALDICEEPSDCKSVHEADVMRKARKLYIKFRSWHTVAEKLNARGWYTRSGKPWSRKNIRCRVMSSNAMTNRLIWRGSEKAQLGADGELLYGRRVVIKLPKLFSKKEIQELKAVAEVAQRPKTTTPGRPFFLTAVLGSPCGSTYQGKTSRPGNHTYLCKNHEPKFPGDTNTCDCSRIDAKTVEDHVWAEACKVLADADRMKAMAADWISARKTSSLDFAKRLAELDQQIAEQDDAIDLTTTMAAKNAARRGFRGEEAEASVERAVKPLIDEVAALQKQRRDLESWQREAKLVEERAQSLEDLAKSTQGRLGKIPPNERAAILHTLKASAKVLKNPASRSGGVECAILNWFLDNDRDVPVLTDEGWERIRPIVARRSNQQNNRTAVEAMLYKAAMGLRWKDMPERFGSPTDLQSKSFRWLKLGHWEQIMELLADAETVPAFRRDPIEIEVTVKPGGLEFNLGRSSLDPSVAFRSTEVELVFSVAA